jgi:ferredoxin/flavodoxin---NADP+ reductase
VTLFSWKLEKQQNNLGNEKGDSLLNFAGPLGIPSEIEKYGTVVCIGGGVGIAPLYPIIKALKQAGTKLSVFLGQEMKSLLMLEKEIAEFSDELHICNR